MPALLVPVIATALSSTALSSTAIFAVSTIAANVVVAGAALGLGAILSPNQNPKVASQQYQSRQALPGLLYGYGTTKLGGSKFLFEAPNGKYLDGLVHCAGPISRFEAWVLNDVGTNIPSDSVYGDGFGGVNQSKPWEGRISVESRKGLLNQKPANTAVQNLGGKWTPQHRLDGLCYSIMTANPVKEKNFQKVYPNGPPALYVIVGMAPVYDPRDPTQSWGDPSTWKFSVNVALAILHYLTAMRGTDSVTNLPVPYGFGFPQQRIDLPSFIDMANLCDQVVQKKDGTQELRYSLGGTFNMGEEERKVVLARLLSSCDGEICQNADGKVSLRGGQWTEPTVTITQDHILGYEFEGGADALASFNRLKISFSDPFNDFQVIEGDPWDDLDAQALYGETITQDITLSMVQSHGQARRLAKIATAKANPEDKLTITTDLYGLLAMGERIIRVVLPELEIDRTFIVTGFTENANGTCKVSISSLGPEAYTWNPATEEGTAPAVAQGLTQPAMVPDVNNFALSVERYAVGGQVTGLAIRATVDAPDFTEYELHGRIRPVVDGDGPEDGWLEMVSDGQPWSLFYTPVNDNATYEAEVAFWAPYGGTQGPWTAPQQVTAVADTTSPGAPQGFVANGGQGQISYAFTSPNAPNFGSAKIFGGTTNNFANAGSRFTFYGTSGQAFDRSESNIPPGTYYIWVRAYNRSGFGDASSTAGPIQITVT
jgi:hypothetical protein